MNREQRSEKLYRAWTLCSELFNYIEYPEAMDKVIEELQKLLDYYKTKRSIDKEYVVYEGE